MADFIKSRVNVKTRTNKEIFFEVESFHSYNDPRDLGVSFHSLRRDDYNDAVETASKVVANATGGLITKGVSKKSNNRDKLSLYADCIEEASHLFDEMGYENLGNSLRGFSQELKSCFDPKNNMYENILPHNRSATLTRMSVFNATGSNSILPFNYVPARNYGETVGNIRHDLQAMFEVIVKSDALTNGVCQGSCRVKS